MKQYEYWCEECNRIYFYRPAKTPRLSMLYCNGTTTVIGPIVECNRKHQVALLKVPHTPAFLLEFLFIAQWQKAEVRRSYFEILNLTPRKLFQSFLQKIYDHQSWLTQELETRLYELNLLKTVGFDQALPRIYNMVLTEIQTLQKSITNCKNQLFLEIGRRKGV